MNLFKLFKDFLRGFCQGLRENAVSLIELECAEYENIFALLVVGGLVGIPSPPTTLTIRILPLLEREMKVMSSITLNLDDLFGRIVGYFEV